MKTPAFSIGARLMVVYAFLFFVHGSFGATKTWDGSSSGNWATGANWSGSTTPTNADDLVFPASATRKSTTNDFGPVFNANLPVHSMTFTGSNYLVDIAGNRPSFSVSTGITNSIASGTNTITGLQFGLGGSIRFEDTSSTAFFKFDFGGNGSDISLGSHTFTFSPVGTVQVNGNISDTGGITKSDTGRLYLNGSNDFSGSFILSQGILGGTGYIPALTQTGGQIDPGGSFGARGTLHHNGNLTLTADLLIDIANDNPGGYDQLVVNGNVALNSTPNLVPVFTASPSFTTGDEMTIVQNDGSNAVTGTFSGLPEGDIVTTNGNFRFVISYHGGDSNDIVLKSIALDTRIWDGSANGFWTNAANWEGSIAPAASNNLIFPAGVSRTSITNSGAITSFQQIKFTGSNYIIQAPGLIISGDILNSISGGTNTLNTPLTLNAGTIFFQDTSSNAVLTVNSNINLNSHTLAFSPDGAVNVNGAITGTGNVTKADTGVVYLNGSNTYTGTFTLSGGTLSGGGYIPGITASGGTINPGLKLSAPAPTDTGTLRCNGNLTMNNATFAIDIHRNGAQLSADQVIVNGVVALTNTSLAVNMDNFSSSGSITILKKTTAGAIAGTFTGLAEGALFTNGAVVLQISYHGNGSNDITLTKISQLTYTWSGGGGNNFWTNTANWSGGAAPIEHGAVVFPVGAARVSNTNNLGFAYLDSIKFAGSNYVLNFNGTTVAIESGITNSPNSGSNSLVNGTLNLFNGPTFLTTNASAKLGVGCTLTYGASDATGPLRVDGSGQTFFNSPTVSTQSQSGVLEKTGAGNLYLNIAMTFGALNIHAGAVAVNSNVTNSSAEIFSGATIGGPGSIKYLTVDDGGVLNPGFFTLPSSLTVDNLTLQSNSTYVVDVISGLPADISKAIVKNGVVIHSANLLVSLDFPPGGSETFTILDNQGNSPIDGEFKNATEGATVMTTSISYPFAISYIGGNNISVTLTIKNQPVLANIKPVSGKPQLNGTGLHDFTVTILASTNLITWTNIATANVDAAGNFSFTDTNRFTAFPKRFYRVRFP